MSQMGVTRSPFTTTNPATGSDAVPAAQINVGIVDSTDNAAQYINDSLDTSIWTDYQIRNRYEQDRHTYMMPIASPTGFLGNTAAFVQLAAPTLLWIAQWTAARFGVIPVRPALEPADENWVLLDVMPETVSIVLAADGVTPLYRLSGIYVFGHRRPSDDVFDQVRFGRPPYIKDAFVRSTANSLEQFGLLDEGFVTGTGGGSVGGGAGGGFGGTGSTGGGTGGSVGGGGGGSFG
mgnify:CR=1 FL=1